MPGCIHAHGEAAWPEAGELAICSGERTCGYCTEPEARAKNYKSAYCLRKHVYDVHCAGGTKEDYAAVELKNFQPAPSQKKRKATSIQRSASSEGRGRRQSRDGSGKFATGTRGRDPTPHPRARGRPKQRGTRSASSDRSASRASAGSAMSYEYDNAENGRDDDDLDMENRNTITLSPQPAGRTKKAVTELQRRRDPQVVIPSQQLEESDDELPTDDELPKGVTLDASYKIRRGGTLVNEEGATLKELKYQVMIQKCKEDEARAKGDEERAKRDRFELEMKLAKMERLHQNTKTMHHVALTSVPKKKTPATKR